MKKKTKLLYRDSFLATILSCLIALILMLIVKNVSFLNPFVSAMNDFNLHDIYYSESFEPSDKINTDIVLVNAAHHDREALAILIEKIIENDPKVIGLDIIFEEKKEAFSDSVLSEVLSNEKIVNAFNLIDGNVRENHSSFQNINKEGYVNFNFDSSSYVIRKFSASNNERGQYLSFGAQVSKQFLGSKWNDYKYYNKLSKERIIKYFGNQEKFITLNLEDFLDYEKTTFLKDKIVLVGYLGPKEGKSYDIEDKYFTPMNQHMVGRGDRDMYGMVIHANIINMLINNNFIFELHFFWILILTFLFMFFTTMFLMKMDKKQRFSYRLLKHNYLFILSIFLVGISLFLFKYNIVVEVAPIIVGTLFAASYVKYYKDLVKYVKKKLKWKWKTYLK